MTNKEQVTHSAELFKQCLGILEKKGIAYSGDTDAHANFKRNGEALGISQYQTLAVYMMKHIDCILGAINVCPDKPADATEGLRGRITDAINYLSVLSGMLREDDL